MFLRHVQNSPASIYQKFNKNKFTPVGKRYFPSYYQSSRYICSVRSGYKHFVYLLYLLLNIVPEFDVW